MRIWKTIADVVGIGPLKKLWVYVRGGETSLGTSLPGGLSLTVAGERVLLYVPTAAGCVLVPMDREQALGMAWGFWSAARCVEFNARGDRP